MKKIDVNDRAVEEYLLTDEKKKKKKKKKRPPPLPLIFFGDVTLNKLIFLFGLI